MTALSIRHMRFTIREMEHLEAQNQSEWYARLPEDVKADRSHYWHIEKKSRNGKKWIFVRDLQATKKEAAEIFCKNFRNRDVKYRLRHRLAY